MFSLSIEKQGNHVLFIDDNLTLRVEIENPTDKTIEIDLDLKLIMGGKTIDIEMPNIEMSHAIPAKTTSNIPVIAAPGIPITRQWSPGDLYALVEAKPTGTNQAVKFDSVHIFIESRLIHPSFNKLAIKGNSIDKMVVWGHYGLICGADAGDGVNYRTREVLINDIQTIKALIPGQVAVRCWVLGSDPGIPTFWNYQNGQYNLNSFNETYIARLIDFCNIFKQNGIMCILDLFDHYTMYNNSIWPKHSLYPGNNQQRTFGLPAKGSAFPEFYQLENYPGFAEFQKRYVQKVAEVLKDNEYVIFSTGNEMVDGSTETRRLWHKKVSEWIKEKNPNAIVTENDHGSSVDIHSMASIDMISVHSLGGVICDGHECFKGSPNWNFFKQWQKPVLLDNDGLWNCRDHEQNAVAWWRLVRDCGCGYYGAKGPFPSDPRWISYGLPILTAIGSEW